MSHEDDAAGAAERHDAHSLRALAHPTRWRILEILLSESTVTATRAAEVLGEPVNGCSFHLRTLAKHGYVEHAESPDGRERRWRLVEQRVQWQAADDDPSADALNAMLIEREAERQRSFLQTKGRLEPEWRDATLATGAYRWMTSAELRELNAEMEQLLERHRDRADPSKRPADARLVRLLSINLPDVAESVGNDDEQATRRAR